MAGEENQQNGANRDATERTNHSLFQLKKELGVYVHKNVAPASAADISVSSKSTSMYAIEGTDQKTQAVDLNKSS